MCKLSSVRRPCGVPQHQAAGSAQAPASPVPTLVRLAIKEWKRGHHRHGSRAWARAQNHVGWQRVHSQTRGLTLPSRGRPTSGFAGCRPPLMSNVRPRANQMRSMLVRTVEIHRSAAVRGSSLHRLVKRNMRCIGAGRPSVGGRRTVLSCRGFLQHRLGCPSFGGQRTTSSARKTCTGRTGACVQRPCLRWDRA